MSTWSSWWIYSRLSGPSSNSVSLWIGPGR
jgi:hypothetical protein